MGNWWLCNLIFSIPLPLFFNLVTFNHLLNFFLSKNNQNKVIFFNDIQYILILYYYLLNSIISLFQIIILETDDFVPKWYPLDKLPYKDMPEDDEWWYPRVLQNKECNKRERLLGEFTFQGSELDSHSVQSVSLQRKKMMPFFLFVIY